MRIKLLQVYFVVVIVILCPLWLYSFTAANETLEEPVVEVFSGGAQYAFLLCWDDFSKDLDFSFIEDEVGIKHTTFAVTGRIQTKFLAGLDMLFRGHDIQSHSRKHVHHATLNSSYREYLIRQSKLDIEKIYGYTPLLFAYPYGSQNADCHQQVLQYFAFGRGIHYETDNQLGLWPMESSDNLGHVKHSFPSIHGIDGETMDKLVPEYERMIELNPDKHRAFKCYGHMREYYFTLSEREKLGEYLSEISAREDTWCTSWGKAVAYQIEREEVNIVNYQYSRNRISFQTKIGEASLGVALTYRIQIPDGWRNITVRDNGKISHLFEIKNVDGKVYALVDSIPNNQNIVITVNRHIDTTSPVISNMRAITTDEGVAFLCDVDDTQSMISDVNISIVRCNFIMDFHRVQNPVFWSNSTYGRVVFEDPNASYHVVFSASDSSGNLAECTLIYHCPSVEVIDEI